MCVNHYFGKLFQYNVMYCDYEKMSFIYGSVYVHMFLYLHVTKRRKQTKLVCIIAYHMRK